MTLIKCPDCSYGKVEMEVTRSWGGDFITAWDTCPTCKGAGEVERRNVVEQIEVVVGRLTGRAWVSITRSGKERRYEMTDRTHSANRLEHVLTDAVEAGQLSMVYQHITGVMATFYPSQLKF